MSKPIRYPQSRTAKADAWFVVAAWLAMPVFMVLLFMQLSAPEPSTSLLVIASLFGTAIIAHVALAFAHRCPSCNKHPTLQGFKPTHPDARSQSTLSGWGGAVVNIVRRQRLVCIHCGSRYSVE